MINLDGLNEVERSKAISKNLCLSAIKIFSFNYTKEKSKEMEEAITEFPLYDFEPLLARKILRNLKLGNPDIILDYIKNLKLLLNNEQN